MDFMGDNVSLSPEQIDKILQFQNVTDITDPDICRDILQRNEWNLEVAVQEQLNLIEGKPSIYATTNRPPPVINDISGRVYHSTSYSSITAGFYDAAYHFCRRVILAITTFCYNSFETFLFMLLRILGVDPQGLLMRPHQDVTKFIQSYNNKFTPAHPVFYQGTFSQVLIDAKRELKLLLVYLHNEDAVDTLPFCRETLADPEVYKYINQNYLFWGCASRYADPQILDMFAPRNYPFMAVVVLKEGHMTIVVRMEGFCTADALYERLDRIVDDCQPFLETARAARLELNYFRSVRAHQDQAYMESLRVDQEKEKKRQEERRVLLEEIYLKEAEELAENQRKERIAKDKLEAILKVPEEPEQDDPDAVHFVIKFACGTRLDRRFLKTDSLEAIYYYVFAQPTAPDVFEITTNFPKRVLECRPAGMKSSVKTIMDAGLKSREVLFVNDIDG